jgi:hypothetical protein
MKGKTLCCYVSPVTQDDTSNCDIETAKEGRVEMYRVIDTRIWTDPEVKALSVTEKLVFVYLITNQHTHVSGIYYLPKPFISHELGISNSTVTKALDTLSRGYLCFYDTPTEVVWVKNLLRFQGRGSKIVASVAKQLESLHKCPLIVKFLDHYED